jgi:CDP-4-dehydro-6-deoxyglucose reductase
MVVKLQLPANDTCATTRASTSSSSCATARAAATRWPMRRTTGPGVELHIRHMPGGKFTDHVFGAMKEKEILRVEGPFGSFFLREDSDKPMVLLASGTGFAPIKALIEHMQFKGITAAGHAVLGRPPPRRPVHGRLGARAAAPRCRT